MFHCLVNNEYGAYNPNDLWTTSWETGFQTYLLLKFEKHESSSHAMLLLVPCEDWEIGYPSGVLYSEKCLDLREGEGKLIFKIHI